MLPGRKPPTTNQAKLNYKYSKTFLTDPLHRSTIPLNQSLYFGAKQSPIQILELLKPVTSLNEPLKLDSIYGRFREVLLYTQRILDS